MLKYFRKGSRRFARTTLALSICILAVVLAGIVGCLASPPSQAKVDKRFADSTMESPSFQTYAWQGHSCFYAESGQSEQTPVIFIHGSPGSWDNFLTFFSSPPLREVARLVAVDRPGFGRSSDTGPVRSLENQSEALAAVLPDPGSSHKAILVGHSLGGAVAVRLAVDYPERVGGLLLVAPSISPELEKLRWYNRLAAFPAVKWILPRSFRHSNEEILPLKAELEKLEPHIPDIAIPIIVIQGMRDRLVPPGNADYVAEHFSSASVDVRKDPELNHFIPWTRPGLIEEAVLELLKRQPRPDPAAPLQP